MPSETTTERVAGIEPAYHAWEARVLPLNYTRLVRMIIRYAEIACQVMKEMRLLIAIKQNVCQLEYGFTRNSAWIRGAEMLQRLGSFLRCDISRVFFRALVF